MKAEPVFPPQLKEGDCIGLFSPSGPVRSPEKFEAGIQLLHDMGFCTKQYPGATGEHEYLAADDSTRAKEFQTMLSDPDINAMLAVRGGYGCLRLMHLLDLEILRNYPKPVIGFSDLTILLNTLVDRTGLVTFHGPVLTSLVDSDTDSIASFKSALTNSIPQAKSFANIKILRNGAATGILKGGNLTTLAHLIGTPWEIQCNNSLLLLEDTGEPMYKIDRLLTQLYAGGTLQQVSGILLGTFDSGSDENINLDLQDKVWERVLELTVEFDCPVWGNFPIGHCAKNHTIPLGATACMDSEHATISLTCT